MCRQVGPVDDLGNDTLTTLELEPDGSNSMEFEHGRPHSHSHWVAHVEAPNWFPLLRGILAYLNRPLQRHGIRTWPTCIVGSVRVALVGFRSRTSDENRSSCSENRSSCSENRTAYGPWDRSRRRLFDTNGLSAQTFMELKGAGVVVLVV